MENQRYFIQETNTGITAIIDPFGKIVGRLPEFQRMIMTDSVSGMIGITPYQKYGNYPIVTLCCLILLLAFIIKFYFSQIFLRSTKNEENIIN
jgi:apolipoprotein N-acyltransferase